MTLTPSLRAISLCSFPCVANSFACANFVAISALECFFLLAIAACIRPSLRCCRKSFIAAVLHNAFPARQWQPFIALQINTRDAAAAWCAGMECEISMLARLQIRRCVASGTHCWAMWIGLTESRGAGGTDQAAG